MRIAAYKATSDKRGVTITRCIGTSEKSRRFTDFDTMAEALTTQISDCFHVVWNLKDFSEAIFTLLPDGLAGDLLSNVSKGFHGNTKIFYVDRILGLTYNKHLQGNTYKRQENNFYGLTSWLTEQEPETVLQLAGRGEDILQALKSIGISPDKLTSPVGILSDRLKDADLPTIYSNDNDLFVDACDYAIKTMRHEWRSAFKIGHFDSLYCYDQTSAYPALIADLPDTDHCDIEYSEKYINSDFAVMKGQVTITAEVSPIGFTTAEGVIFPRGTWETYLTKSELHLIEKYRLGTFNLTDGYFFKFRTPKKPFQALMMQLFQQRQTDNDTLQTIIKRMAAGMSGKLDQDNSDGTYGELFNPIYALMVRSGCRVKVAEFVYNNLPNLESLVDINVDGVLSTDPAINLSDQTVKKMGEWRLEKTQKALILGKGEVWREDKKPLNLSYTQVIEALREKPENNYYEIGKRYVIIDANANNPDRKYTHYPVNGREALTMITDSQPLSVGYE